MIQRTSLEEIKNLTVKDFKINTLAHWDDLPYLYLYFTDNSFIALYPLYDIGYYGDIEDKTIEVCTINCEKKAEELLE